MAVSARWARHKASDGVVYRVRPGAVLDARISRGLSVRHLAARAKCSPSMVSYLCTGARETVSEVLAVALARALTCAPGDLVEGWPAAGGAAPPGPVGRCPRDEITPGPGRDAPPAV